MTTRKGVTEQAAAAAIDGGCRTLRLPTIRSRFGEIAAAAEREQLSYLGFLAELVMAECDDRDSRRTARRMNAAGFPRDKRVDEFDFAANPNVPAATVHHLAGCGWVKAGQPLCLIGDSGTGKSHLLIALGTAAAQGRALRPLRSRIQVGQRARRGRRRQAAVQDHRSLRPGRPADL